MPEVRPARAEDLDGLRALLAELHAEDAPWDEDAARGALAAILADPRRRLLLAFAEEDNGGGGAPRAAGTVDVVVVPNLTRGARPYAVIENVVVAARFRRRGIGRALMDAAVAHARESGCYKLQLISGGARGEAHRLYEAAGFSDAFHGYRRYL
jgi:ribosomal protein S18 acetylase RimI-like enzyme